MKNSQRRSTGFSLLEVVIASSLMLILMTAFYAVAEALKKSQVVSDARVEARQNLRNAMKRTNYFFSQASWIYTNGTVTINGFTCGLPYPDSANPGEYLPGNTLAFAVPVDQTKLDDPHLNPLDPVDATTARSAGKDGFCDNRYDVIVLTTRALQPADSYNPNARQLVLMRWDSVQPPTPFTPVTIELTTLGDPDNMKVFDCYLKPLADDGFRTEILLEDSTPAAAVVHAEFRFVPQKANSPAQEEVFDYTLTARNIF